MLNKGDKIVLLFLIIITLASFVIIFSVNGQVRAQNIMITAKGRPFSTVTLWQNKIVKIRGQGGGCLLQIKNGKARVIKSPCLQKICMKQGWIANEGDTIICLPMQIIIKVVSDKIRGVDSVSR